VSVIVFCIQFQIITAIYNKMLSTVYGLISKYQVDKVYMTALTHLS